MRPERFPASFSQGPHPTIAKLEAEIVYRVKMHCMIAYGRYTSLFCLYGNGDCSVCRPHHPPTPTHTKIHIRDCNCPVNRVRYLARSQMQTTMNMRMKAFMTGMSDLVSAVMICFTALILPNSLPQPSAQPPTTLSDRLPA